MDYTEKENKDSLLKFWEKEISVLNNEIDKLEVIKFLETCVKIGMDSPEMHNYLCIPNIGSCSIKNYEKIFIIIPKLYIVKKNINPIETLKSWINFIGNENDNNDESYLEKTNNFITLQSNLNA